MSNQEVVILRDRYGHKIGMIKIDRDGNKILHDEYGHKKGRYDKKRDCVYDEYGHLVGRGDMLTSLL